MQHHPGPARTEHHVEFAGRCRHRLEIDQRLAHRVVDRALPGAGLDEALVALAPAIAVAAALLPVAIARHYRDVDAHQRADVAIGLAVGTQDLDHLPGRAERHRHLPYPRILRARVSVDLLEQLHLGLE